MTPTTPRSFASRPRRSARFFVVLWLVLSAIRVGGAMTLLWLEIKGRVHVGHLPLVFLQVPEALLLTFDPLMVHPLEKALVLALALCASSAVMAGAITLIVCLFARLERGHPPGSS